MTKLISILGLATSLLGIAALPLRAGNIVQNPSFETGSCRIDLGNCGVEAPWIFTAGPIDSLFGVSGGPSAAPGGGSFGAWFGGGDPAASGTSYDTISQLLTTIPGQYYDLTFWLDTSAHASNADFRVLWDGVVIYDDTAGTDPPHQFAYKLISIPGLAGTGSDTLAFQAYNPPGNDKFDLVDVEQSAPEPGSWMLVCIGALAIAYRKTR